MTFRISSSRPMTGSSLFCRASSTRSGAVLFQGLVGLLRVVAGDPLVAPDRGQGLHHLLPGARCRCGTAPSGRCWRCPAGPAGCAPPEIYSSFMDGRGGLGGFQGACVHVLEPHRPCPPPGLHRRPRGSFSTSCWTAAWKLGRVRPILVSSWGMKPLAVLDQRHRADGPARSAGARIPGRCLGRPEWRPAISG